MTYGRAVSSPRFEIRPARPTDVARLQQIDIATGAQFAEVGHPELDDGDHIPHDVALSAIDANCLFVADAGAHVLGYVYVTRSDGELCVGQISVDPTVQQHGVGTALMRHVMRRAADVGERSIVLSTQSDVVWNRPWYETLGFRVVMPADWTPDMHTIAVEQSAAGCDWSTRVFMRLVLGS